jgi:hypothetical protein
MKELKNEQHMFRPPKILVKNLESYLGKIILISQKLLNQCLKSNQLNFSKILYFIGIYYCKLEIVKSEMMEDICNVQVVDFTQKIDFSEQNIIEMQMEHIILLESEL